MILFEDGDLYNTLEGSLEFVVLLCDADLLHHSSSFLLAKILFIHVIFSFITFVAVAFALTFILSIRNKHIK